MCRFDYNKYDACTHWTIECHEQCSRSLWHGGRFGFLRLCTPSIFERSLEWPGLDEDEPPKPVQFLGVTGFCPACVDAFHIYPRQNERNEESDQILKYAPGIFDSEDIAPYFVVEAFRATIPYCLGIADQYEDKQVSQGVPVRFKQPSIMHLTWAELRRMQPFRILGQMVGVEEPMPIEQVHVALKCIGGLTIADKQTITRALRRGENILALYDAGFKDRGMPFSYYSNAMQRFQEMARQHLAETQQEQREEQGEASTASASTLVPPPKPATFVEYDGDKASYSTDDQADAVGSPEIQALNNADQLPTNMQNHPAPDTAPVKPGWKKSKAVPTRTQPPRQAKSAFTSGRRSFKLESPLSDGCQLDDVAQSTPSTQQDANMHTLSFGRLSMADSQPSSSGTSYSPNSSLSEGSLEAPTVRLNQNSRNPRSRPTKRNVSAMHGDPAQAPAPKRAHQ